MNNWFVCQKDKANTDKSCLDSIKGCEPSANFTKNCCCAHTFINCVERLTEVNVYS